MKVSDIITTNDFKVVAGDEGLDNEIAGVYIGDLLSWVMGKAKENNVWITIQGHLNVIAVGVLVGVSCIIIAEGAEVNDDTIVKANAEDLPILTTTLSSYEVAEIFMKMKSGE